MFILSKFYDRVFQSLPQTYERMDHVLNHDIGQQFGHKAHQLLLLIKTAGFVLNASLRDQLYDWCLNHI